MIDHAGRKVRRGRLVSCGYATLFMLALAGCAATPDIPRVTVRSANLSEPNFVLHDLRPESSRTSRLGTGTIFLGDENFEVPPPRLIALRFTEKLGGLVQGRQVSLLEFQARLTLPEFQTYPGMPLESEALGRLLKLPQLGYPHHANVSLRGEMGGETFTGAASIQFYLGSGKSETAEAFDAALNDASDSLQALLVRLDSK